MEALHAPIVEMHRPTAFTKNSPLIGEHPQYLRPFSDLPLIISRHSIESPSSSQEAVVERLSRIEA